MNRTQLIIMWVGIAILVLMGLFPPGTRGGYDFILEARSVSLSRLIIEWSIVIMLTGGLIYSLKIDPDLMLKIPCQLLSLFHLSEWFFPRSERRSYQQILKDAKEDKSKTIVFWGIVLVLFLLVLIAIRLSIPAWIPPVRPHF